MSTYYAINGAAPDFLASNRGWGDACRWIDSVSPEKYPEVTHLREHGWCQNVPALAAELGAMLADDRPPDEDSAGVFADLAEIAGGGADGDVLTIPG